MLAPLRYTCILIALFCALLPALALACGLPLDARINAEQALLIYVDGRQQLITSVDLSEVGGRAAVLFPVPGEPEVDQPTGGEELFAYLNEATKPLRQEQRRVVWGNAPLSAGRATEGVQVLGREIIGGYDVARLAANDAQALEQWLDANGYSMPADAQPILAAYVQEGWHFVAVKLAPGGRAGSLAPLRMSFTADEIVYPMRLGALADRPVAVQLYVLTDQRVTIDQLETRYAGPRAQLDPAPPDSLAALLDDAPYLTRMEAAALDPQSLTDDFVARPAPNNEPFRAVETVYTDVPAAQVYGVPAAMICLAGISIMAFLVGLLFKRRFDAINPDKTTRS